MGSYFDKIAYDYQQSDLMQKSLREISESIYAHDKEISMGTSQSAGISAYLDMYRDIQEIVRYYRYCVDDVVKTLENIQIAYETLDAEMAAQVSGGE